MGNLDLNWRMLRGVLILLGIALSSTLSMAWSGFYFQALMEKEVAKLRQQTQAIKRQAADAVHEKELVETHLPAYKKLQAREIVGDDTQSRRLAWIENAKIAAEYAQLPAMRYNLTPRKVQPLLLPVQKQEMELFASAMDLELGLLHEGDLLHYLDTLQQMDRGFFTVAFCELTRNDQGRALSIKTVMITSRCRLLWMTIAKKPAESAP